MSDLPVRLRLIEKICRNYSAFSAEGLMYGISVFLGMRFHDQLTYLSEEGYEDRKYFRSETNKARKIIMQAGLDIDLIRYGSPMILPFFSEPIYPEPEDSSVYQSLLDLEETVSFGDIAAKVISELDPVYMHAFRTGNGMNDVFSYYQFLQDRFGLFKPRENVASLLYGPPIYED